MKVLMTQPYWLGVRPARAGRGWEIVCEPGPLAMLFVGLARDLGACNGDGPRVEEIGGRAYEVIPLTAALDEAVVQLVDALITLRYESGRVQLELFSLDEELK